MLRKHERKKDIRVTSALRQSFIQNHIIHDLFIVMKYTWLIVTCKNCPQKYV